MRLTNSFRSIRFLSGAQVGADRLPSDGDYDTALTGDITLIASGTEIADHSRVPVGMIVNTGIYGRSKEA